MNNITVLVTGGSGFVGVHIILQLLQQGFTVKTTVRSLSKKETVINTLKDAGIIDFNKLSFYESELTSDHGWNEAVQNTDFVLHIASPFVAEFIKKERPDLSANIANMQPTSPEFYTHISNKKSVETFGWQPRSKEEALLASLDSLYNH